MIVTQFRLPVERSEEEPKIGSTMVGHNGGGVMLLLLFCNSYAHEYLIGPWRRRAGYIAQKIAQKKHPGHRSSSEK